MKFFFPCFHLSHITVCVLNLNKNMFEWFDNKEAYDFSDRYGERITLLVNAPNCHLYTWDCCLYNLYFFTYDIFTEFQTEAVSRLLAEMHVPNAENIVMYPHTYKAITRVKSETFDCGVYAMAYMQYYQGQDKIRLDLSNVSVDTFVRKHILMI